MGCKSSRVVVYVEETKDLITNRRQSHCSVQSTNLTADESSILSYRGKRKNSLTSNPDVYGSKRKNSLSSNPDTTKKVTFADLPFKLETIESGKIYLKPTNIPTLNFIRVRKYRNPLYLEGYDYDFNDVVEVALQPDSWYPKRRPNLRIKIDHQPVMSLNDDFILICG